jgi:hypothetical protein
MAVPSSLLREPATAMDRTWYIDPFGGGKTGIGSPMARFPGFLLFPPEAPVQN